MHMHVVGSAGLSGANCRHLAVPGGNASAPLPTQRQQSVLRQQSIHHAHSMRRSAGTCSAMDSSGQGPQDLYRNINAQHQAANGDYSGPQLVPLDAESPMGLGGTSEDIYGELVSLTMLCENTSGKEIP